MSRFCEIMYMAVGLAVLAVLSCSCNVKKSSSNFFTEFCSASDSVVFSEGISPSDILRDTSGLAAMEMLICFSDPTCSFCISNVISCVREYSESGLDLPLVVALSGSYFDLFDYYWDRDVVKTGTDLANVTVAEADADDLPYGLYYVKQGTVVNYSFLNNLSE